MRYTVTTEKPPPANNPEIIYDGENYIEAQAQYLRQLMWDRPAILFLDGKVLAMRDQITEESTCVKF